MQFLVIENNRSALDLLILALRTSFTGSTIAPKPGNTTDKWSSADALLAKEAVDEAGQIIFCDLALDSDDPADARAGLERVRNLFAIKPNATWIAYTSFTEIVELDEARGLFHGILNKQDLSRYRTPAEQAAFVARIVQSSSAQRTGEKRAVYFVEDSLGMRTFFAVFPDPVLDELIAAECSQWKEINICALSAGYSGSSLLAIRGKKEGVPRHIVVKIAPRRDLIERESRVLNSDGQFFGETEEFSQKCARAQEPKSLPKHFGYYSLQGAIAGPTLAALYADEPGSMAAIDGRDSGLRTLIDIELVQYARGWKDTVNEAKRRSHRMGLSAVDKHRAKKTCHDLPEMAEVISDQGGWAADWPKPSELFSRIDRMVDRWEVLLSSVSPLCWVLQHGDLNPNNVIVDDAGQITFIDLARLDHWPVGYDLCRLIIQFRIRLTDRNRGTDWIQNNLGRWRKESLFALDGTADPAVTLCTPATVCEQRLYSWMKQQSDAQGLIQGARLCAVFDLIRIISYSDLSPYKRLWAALELWNLAELLGWQDNLLV